MSDISASRDILIIVAAYAIYKKYQKKGEEAYDVLSGAAGIIGNFVSAVIDYSRFIMSGGELAAAYRAGNANITKTELRADVEQAWHDKMTETFGPQAPKLKFEYIQPVSTIDQGTVIITPIGGTSQMPAGFFAWSPHVNPDGTIQIW